MGEMKKTIKFIALALLALLIVALIYYISSPKMLDFRGTVTEIEVVDELVVFHISTESIGTSYIVVADSQTKVSHCHKDDPQIVLSDIKVGDTIEGDYRKMSGDQKAKFITVWYKNK